MPKLAGDKTTVTQTIFIREKANSVANFLIVDTELED